MLLVVADDAARATPRVNDAIADAGGEVESSREYRPSFDEIFAELVNRHDQTFVAEADAEARAEK